MSSNLGVGKTLELLERLRTTVREFAARAEKLNAEFNTRAGKEKRLRETAAEQEAQALAATIGAVETAFAAAKAAARAKHEARKIRIGEAYQASKETALANVETQTGTRKYELQKAMLQAERDRGTGLTTAASTLEEYRTNAAAEQEALATLEATGCRAFRGYRKFVRGLADAYQKAATPAASLDENQLLTDLREVLAKTRSDLEHFGKFWLLRVFKYLPLWVLVVLGVVPLVLWQYGLNSAAYWKAGLGAAGGLAVVLALRGLAVSQAKRLAATIAGALGKARLLHNTGVERAEAHYQQEVERIKNEFETTTRTVRRLLCTRSCLRKSSSQPAFQRSRSKRPWGNTHVSGSWASASGGHGHTMSG